MRLARATRAVTPATAVDPEAVRVRCDATAAVGRRSVTGTPSSRNAAGIERKQAALAEPVFQHDRAVLEADHRAAETLVRVLDNEIEHGVDLLDHPRRATTVMCWQARGSTRMHLTAPASIRHDARR